MARRYKNRRRCNPAGYSPRAIVAQLLARLRTRGIQPEGAADLRWAAGRGAHELYATLVGLDKDFRAAIAEMEREAIYEDARGRRAFLAEARDWRAALDDIRRAIHQVDATMRRTRNPARPCDVPIPVASTIRTRADVLRWFRMLVRAGVNFHPDDAPPSCLRGIRARRYKAAMRRVFRVVKDPYSIGMQVFREAGLA